jgi:hypothetical protein
MNIYTAGGSTSVHSDASFTYHTRHRNERSILDLIQSIYKLNTSNIIIIITIIIIYYGLCSFKCFFSYHKSIQMNRDRPSEQQWIYYIHSDASVHSDASFTYHMRHRNERSILELFR